MQIVLTYLSKFVFQMFHYPFLLLGNTLSSLLQNRNASLKFLVDWFLLYISRVFCDFSLFVHVVIEQNVVEHIPCLGLVLIRERSLG